MSERPLELQSASSRRSGVDGRSGRCCAPGRSARPRPPRSSAGGFHRRVASSPPRDSLSSSRSRVVTVSALFALGRALWPLRRSPTDRQLARFIEEHAPADWTTSSSPPLITRRVPMHRRSMRELLAADAARALRGARPGRSRLAPTRFGRRAARGRGDRPRSPLPRCSSRRRRSRHEPRGRVSSSRRVSAVEVTPGSTKVRAGQPVTITARVHGLNGGVVPTLTE